MEISHKKNTSSKDFILYSIKKSIELIAEHPQWSKSQVKNAVKIQWERTNLRKSPNADLSVVKD